MPGPNFRPSILDCELLPLIMSTHATPMFMLTDSALRPEISALDRPGRLEMQTHRKCPPRWISPLECVAAHRRTVPASPLESALTKQLASKSFRLCTYIKIGGGWGSSFSSSTSLTSSTFFYLFRCAAQGSAGYGTV